MATADSVKAKIQGLIDQSNATTGNTDADLTTAVNSLIAGFGQGGGGENLLDYVASLNGMFAGVAFEEGTELEIKFGSKTNGVNSGLFGDTFSQTTGLKSVKVVCETSVGARYSMQRIASKCTLETIDLSGMPQPLTPNTMYRPFYYATKLKTILGEFDLTGQALSNPFDAAAALETVRFTPGTIEKNMSMWSCPNLTDETIQSVIDGLADLTDGTAQTLTLHADVGAKLTEEQIASATAKNWTLSY